MKTEIIHGKTKIFAQLYSAAIQGILSNQDLIQSWSNEWDPQAPGFSGHSVEKILVARISIFARHLAFQGLEEVMSENQSCHEEGSDELLEAISQGAIK